jgi:hypothetical protein
VASCSRFILAVAGMPEDGQSIKARVRVRVARMMCIFFRLLDATVSVFSFGFSFKEISLSIGYIANLFQLKRFLP